MFDNFCSLCYAILIILIMFISPTANEERMDHELKALTHEAELSERDLTQRATAWWREKNKPYEEYSVFKGAWYEFEYFMLNALSCVVAIILNVFIFSLYLNFFALGIALGATICGTASVYLSAYALFVRNEHRTQKRYRTNNEYYLSKNIPPDDVLRDKYMRYRVEMLKVRIDSTAPNTLGGDIAATQKLKSRIEDYLKRVESTAEASSHDAVMQQALTKAAALIRERRLTIVEQVHMHLIAQQTAFKARIADVEAAIDEQNNRYTGIALLHEGRQLVADIEQHIEEVTRNSLSYGVDLDFACDCLEKMSHSVFDGLDLDALTPEGQSSMSPATEAALETLEEAAQNYRVPPSLQDLVAATERLEPAHVAVLK
jgi:hypothetical protein